MLEVIFILQSQRSLARACSASHQALEEIYEDSQVPFDLVILGGFTCHYNMNEHQIVVCHQKPPGSVHGEVFQNSYSGYCFQQIQEENVVTSRCETGKRPLGKN